MARVRVPTLQHMARNWHADPDWICKNLVRLVQNPPNFNYELLFRLARDMLLLGQPYEDILAAVGRIKRKDLRDKFLEILPLLRDHFEGEQPDYFQDIEPRLYSIGRGLMVPFAPPFVYGVGGQIYFPWLSFWRTNPLANERLSLFVTIVRRVLLDDPDLEDSIFQIVDFSAPLAKGTRELRIVPAAEVPILSENRMREMLEVFAEGYFRAQKILAAMPPAAPEKGPESPKDDSQPDMFDEPRE
jgi:hypothetical protein